MRLEPERLSGECVDKAPLERESVYKALYCCGAVALSRRPP